MKRVNRFMIDWNMSNDDGQKSVQVVEYRVCVSVLRLFRSHNITVNQAHRRESLDLNSCVKIYSQIAMTYEYELY